MMMPLSEIQDSNQTKLVMDNIDVHSLTDDILYGFKIFSGLLTQCSKHAQPFIDITYQRDGKNDELIKLGDINFRIMFFKFARNQYRSVTEVIADLRRIIELCYNEYGLFLSYSKNAEILELVMQQKLRLYPKYIQDQCRLEATNLIQNREYLNARLDNGGRRRLQSSTDCMWTPLMFQIDYIEKLQAGLVAKQKIESKRRESEITERKLDIFLNSNFYNHAMKEIRYCWELPCIGSLLYMLRAELNIEKFSYTHFELSAFCMEKSRLYQRIFSSLLMSSLDRNRNKKPFDYEEWSEKLATRIASWYQVYSRHGKEKVMEKFGIHGRFFDVMGESNPLIDQEFQEFSVRQKLVTLHALCEFVLYKDQNLCNALTKIPILQRQDIYLGGLNYDRETYHFFPQFGSTDVRVYKFTYEEEAQAEMRDFEAQSTHENKSFELVASNLDSLRNLLDSLSAGEETPLSTMHLIDTLTGVYEEFNLRRDTFEKEGRLGLIAAMNDSSRVAPL